VRGTREHRQGKGPASAEDGTARTSLTELTSYFLIHFISFFLCARRTALSANATRTGGHTEVARSFRASARNVSAGGLRARGAGGGGGATHVVGLKPRELGRLLLPERCLLARARPFDLLELREVSLRAPRRATHTTQVSGPHPRVQPPLPLRFQTSDFLGTMVIFCTVTKDARTHTPSRSVSKVGGGGGFNA
jgi:hypothetical protein